MWTWAQSRGFWTFNLCGFISPPKYHDFFDADGQLVLADIGHYGSEQFTAAVIKRYLEQEFPTFAVHLTETVTDPTQYS